MADTSPFDATVEVDSSRADDLQSLDSMHLSREAPIAMVEGSGPGLTTEMQHVLRWRLRVAALVLFGGFLVFLIYRIFTRDWADGVTGNLFIAQIVVTAILGFCGFSLCRRCPSGMRSLRIKELIVFGVPAAFFLMMQWYWITKCAEEHQIIPTVAGPWLLLMFTYAMFIPNTWQRATMVLGAMAVAPVILMILLWTRSSSCSVAFSDDPGVFVQNVLLLLIAASTASVGTHTIGTLRRQAFAAKQLGQYRLRKLIGVGGMGEVYLAEHQMMKRPCAIKLIHPEKAGDPEVLARFEREVRATAKLTHWNSIEIFDYGRADDGTFYYVMEYLPGLSLGDLVARNGPLAPARVVHLLRQVCDALREAHGRGMIHRDIKPGNIFAAQRGGVYDVAKLLDFGLVKPIVDTQESELTQDGSIAGSPLYMSPEQATGEVVDQRSDIYALGAVAYFLLTGRPPFEADKPLKVIVAHAHKDVIPPSQLRSDIPHDLEQIVMRCLEKSPDDRFGDVVELSRALSQCEIADGWSSDDARSWWESDPAVREVAAEEVAVSP